MLYEWIYITVLNFIFKVKKDWFELFNIIFILKICKILNLFFSVFFAFFQIKKINGFDNFEASDKNNFILIWKNSTNF